MRIVPGSELSELISMPQAIDAVRGAFRDYADGQFEMPARQAFCDGSFLVMTVVHRPSLTMMVKSLSLNFEGRSPAILGSLSLVSYEGNEVLISDAAEATALRTGAVSGVVTDLLAPADSSVGLIIGAGRQAFEQARAIVAVRNLTRLLIVDIRPAAAEELRDRLRGVLGAGIAVETVTDVDVATRQADIICCATSSKIPVFDAAQLKPRVHINGIGAFTRAMREIPPQALAGATVIVDDVAASLAESGEIHAAVEAGLLTEQDLVPLGRALAGGVSAAERTVFKSVGLAIQDWALIHQLASS